MNGCNEVLESVETVSTPPIGAVNGRKSAPIRIWLVDDNSSFRALLASLLKDEVDFECERQFSSPVSLLRALEGEAAPDVILLDVQMGAYNGLDAVRPIKVLAKSTHVLMLTTFSGPGGREQAFRDGASDFMLKTWPIAEITSHIRQAVEFGSVAGLLTAFLGQGGPVIKTVEPRQVEMPEKSSGFERWLASLRGWLKFSPS